jgi:hypothetical protein
MSYFCEEEVGDIGISLKSICRHFAFAGFLFEFEAIEVLNKNCEILHKKYGLHSLQNGSEG